MNKLIKDTRGYSNVFLLFFVFIFLIITTITIEIYHVYTLKEHIDTEISRGLNIATDTAMLDEYRMSHISKIDFTIAQDTFNDYLHDEMKLNNNMTRIENGKITYELIIQNVKLENEPVKYEVQGVIKTRPILIGKLTSIDIEIPFKVKARNQRFE
jgi:hypothetical protein